MNRTLFLKLSGLNLFSKYRLELMGIGILGVLISHLCSFSNIDRILFFFFLKKIQNLVYIEGFLFLSGFGLYYSFSQNPNIWKFYSRRFDRVYLPYVVMSLPFFVFKDLFVAHYDVLSLFTHISTIAYWIEGNYFGLWYIAATVCLYAVYPIFHKIVYRFSNLFISLLIAFCLLLLIVIGNYFIQKYEPEFYNKHALALDNYFLFFIGSFYAFLSTRYKKVKLVIIYLFFILTFILQRFIPELNYLYDPLKKILIYMPVICILFYMFENIRITNNIRCCLKWLGKYSLELYILHSLFFCSILQICKLFDWAENLPLSILIAISLSLVVCQPISKSISNYFSSRRLL